ncbi:hypothetical protein TWF481_010974 [Arthrobotrys musiformis]|uniref:F-box domain-containing protein n=1 Tax=Arthrobotrys musiformis TaxID=47236 RepID=A0AAV9VWY4_9PEZI
MARYTIEPFTPKKATLSKPSLSPPSKIEKLEEKAANAVRRIKGIRIITNIIAPSSSSSSSSPASSSSSSSSANPRAKTLLQNTTFSTTKSPETSPSRRDILIRSTAAVLKSPHLRNLVHRRQKSNSSSSSWSSTSNNTPNNSAAHRVLFVPELLEVILTYVPSLQVLTSIRQVHPFFKDLVHTSPVLAWQTWTSKSSTPPRRIAQRDTPSTPGLGLYTISNSVEKPSSLNNHSRSSPSTRISPGGGGNSRGELEICTLLLPILSKWWKTIARNTANYRFFQVDQCVYNRFFPPDLLNSINFTRPAIHVDDLILSFTSTYAFLSYGCTHNITLEDRDRDRDHNHDRNGSPSSPSSADGEAEDNDMLPCDRENCPEGLMMQQMDMGVTIEKLLRMMWIPLSETLRRSRDEKFLRLSGLKYTRTMTVTVKARDGDNGEERGVAELNLECMEPYDVSIQPLF